MTLLQYLTTGQPDGTTATTGNTGATLANPGTGGTQQWKTSKGAHGQTGVRQATATSGQSNALRFPLNAPSYQMQATVKLMSPETTPGAQYQWFACRFATGRCFSITWETSGEVRMLDSSNATPFTVAAAGGLALNTQYVFSFVAVNTSPYGAGNGTVRVRVYAVGNPTPLYDVNFTGKNFTTNQFSHVDSGGGTAVGAHGIVDLQVNDGAGSEIADYVPSTPLAQPVVTLGTTKNPSTDTATDGTQDATWPAVANAGSYDARIAASASPAESDFVTIAQGVTSPYQFTGLGKGTFAFGIQAQP